MKGKNHISVCVRCRQEEPLPGKALGRKCHKSDLLEMYHLIEEGKTLIRLSISEKNRMIWDSLSSQRKKLAVFQSWEYGWLYFEVPKNHHSLQL